MSERRERFGYVVITGRYKILDYDKSDGQQIATANNEDAAKLIRRSLNQHAWLVEQRDRLAGALELAAKRLDFLTSWLENTYKAAAVDVAVGREYAQVARDVLVLERDNDALATVERGDDVRAEGGSGDLRSD